MINNPARFCVCGQQETGNRRRKLSVFKGRKRKLIFSALYPHGRKEKICLTYFELSQTYFKIQGTYFSPPENRNKKHAAAGVKIGRQNKHSGSG